MFPYFDLIITLICIAGLYFGAEWLVTSAIRIARKLNISSLVIGLTIVAIGTSAPEFAVTIIAAIRGQVDISVGNIVGSNIFNFGFILGGIAIFKVIQTSKTLVFRDGGLLIIMTAVFAVFIMDGRLQTLEGIIFLTVLASYLIFLIIKREESEEELDDGEFKLLDILWFIVGCVVVIGSSQLFVNSASTIASYFGVSDWVIGVTIVAFGTSAPEIATSAVALFKGNSDMSAGNLIGSNLFNLLGVLGLAAILNPTMLIDQDAQAFSWILLLFTIFVVIAMYTKWQVSKREGISIFALASLCWYLSFSGMQFIYRLLP